MCCCIMKKLLFLLLVGVVIGLSWWFWWGSKNAVMKDEPAVMKDEPMEKDTQVLKPKRRRGLDDVLNKDFHLNGKAKRYLDRAFQSVGQLLGVNLYDYVDRIVIRDVEDPDSSEFHETPLPKGNVSRPYGSGGKADVEFVIDDAYMGRMDAYFDLWKLFVHEIGHVVDFYHLVWSGAVVAAHSYGYDIREWDPSIAFYDFSSWSTGSIEDVYVSRYAWKDPFEDFAESMNIYLNHHQRFVRMMKENETLVKKYDYFKKLFKGQYFYDWPDDICDDYMYSSTDPCWFNEDVFNPETSDLIKKISQ